MTQPGLTPFYITGGTMPRDAVSYLERQADQTLFTALRQGQIGYVLTPRQMGKSSLMVRAADRLRRAGTHVAVLELTALGQNLSIAQWYQGVSEMIGQQLDLEEELEAFWHAHAELPPLACLLQALHEVVLQRHLPNGQVVLFIDEIDVVRSLPFGTDEFFAGIRACYNRRDWEPEWKRLTFCLLGVAAPSDLIQNVQITPFNIGTRIELHDFSRAEAAALSNGISVTGRDGAALLARALYWTSGHPYLTQRLCAAVAENGAVVRNQDVDRLCRELFLSQKGRDTDDNLAIVRNRLLKGPEDVAALLGLYSKVLSGQRIADEESDPKCGILKLSGVVKSEKGFLKVRNRIYATAFDQAWVKSSLPDAEVRRQREAYVRGVRRTLAAVGMVVLVFAGLTTFAITQAGRANKNAQLANANAKNERKARADADRNAGERALALKEANHQRNLADTSASLANARAKEAFHAFEEAAKQKNRANDNARKAIAALTDAQKQKTLADTNLNLADKRMADLKIANTVTKQALSDAQAQRDSAERTAYFSAMNLAQREYENNNLGRTCGLLEEMENSPYKGFEWSYWNRLCHLDLRTIKTAGKVATLSPDGEQIVTGSLDGTVKIWDARTGQERRTLAGKADGAVPSIAFSLDGKLIAANFGKYVVVWDAQTGRVINSLKAADTFDLRAFAFSSDSRRIVTVRRHIEEPNLPIEIAVWNAQTGKQEWAFIERVKGAKSYLSVAFSPDGRRIVTGCEDGTASVWDSETGKSLPTLAGNGGKVYSVAFSPDGSQIVAGCEDGTVRLWEARTGHPLSTLSGHAGRVNTVAFSPNGSQIVAGCLDGTASLWEARTGQPILTLKGHTGEVSSVMFTPDSQHIVTSSGDGTVKIWELERYHVTRLFKHEATVLSAVFIHDGRNVLTLNQDKGQSIWDVKTGYSKFTGWEAGNYVYSGMSRMFTMDGRFFLPAALSPDERLLADCNLNVGRLSDRQTKQLLRTLTGHTNKVLSIAFSPDGHRIVTGSRDNTARVWDTWSGQEIYVLKEHAGAVTSVAFSPDGTRILTGSRDKTAKVWDARTGRPLFALKGHSSGIEAVAFSPDGRRILTGSEDNTAKLWDAKTGREALTLKGHESVVTSVAFSPDGKRILTGSADKTAQIWFSDMDDANTVLKRGFN